MKYAAKKRKLRENLNIGEKVLILAKRIKKRSAPGKFYKEAVQNISYFNKKMIFTIRNKQKIDKKNVLLDKKLKKQQIFAQKIPKTWTFCYCK